MKNTYHIYILFLFHKLFHIIPQNINMTKNQPKPSGKQEIHILAQLNSIVWLFAMQFFRFYQGTDIWGSNVPGTLPLVVDWRYLKSFGQKNVIQMLRENDLYPRFGDSYVILTVWNLLGWSITALEKSGRKLWNLLMKSSDSHTNSFANPTVL